MIVVYVERDIADIAATVGKLPSDIAPHRTRLEHAALWARLGRRRPKRTPPSKLKDRLASIRGHARGLLKSLKIDTSAEAEDGPGDIEILDALILDGEPSEDPLLEATRRIGRLVDIIDGMKAVDEIERRCTGAETVIARLGELTVKPGNSGDAWVNEWIAEMMDIYSIINGRPPGTSVGKSGVNEGIAGGPLIRFLQAAGRPLNLDYGEDALRRRVRHLQEQASKSGTAIRKSPSTRTSRNAAPRK